MSMLTIEIAAPRVPRAHRARHAARSAECDIQMFLMFDCYIVNVYLFEYRALAGMHFHALRMA